MSLLRHQLGRAGKPKGRTAKGFAWVGDHVYDGNVGGAIRKFKTLSRAQEQRVEMLTDPGAIGYRGNNRELRNAEHTRFSV